MHHTGQGTGCLIQIIQCLLQAEHPVGSYRINKAFWLFHKNQFIQLSIQKGRLNIKLENSKVLTNNQRERKKKCTICCNWTECLCVINPKSLTETLRDKARTTTCHVSILIRLIHKNPFAPSWFYFRWRRYQRRRAILINFLELYLNRFLPL